MLKHIRKVITSPNAPKPIGPYSQAVQVDNTVYVSGCLGMDPATMQLVAGGPAEEAKKALENLKEVLSSANSSLTNVVKATIFLDDLNDFGTVNEVYKQFFKEPFLQGPAFKWGKLPLYAMGNFSKVLQEQERKFRFLISMNKIYPA